jgi:hypothetical protein
MFDSEKFNGFIKNELDDLLFNDIWNYYIFNERDLHSSAYHYIRTYFEKRGSASSEEIFVRCEPVLEDMSKPDIVVYKKYDPIYLIELKMFKDNENMDIDSSNDKKVLADITKMQKLIKKYQTVKWSFMIVVYDSDDMYDLNDGKLKRQNFSNTSIININMRRKEGSARKRTDYDKWRKQFDKYLDYHF